MHIEVFEQGSEKAKGWRWHFRSKGRITADAEAFPTKAHAIRAAKAVVRGVVKGMDPGRRVGFTPPKFDAVRAVYVIEFS